MPKGIPLTDEHLEEKRLAMAHAAAELTSLGRAVHRQYLPMVRRAYIQQPACLPVYGEAQEVLFLRPPTDQWGIRSADLRRGSWASSSRAAASAP